jgi:hypothetical protein
MLKSVGRQVEPCIRVQTRCEDQFAFFRSAGEFFNSHITSQSHPPLLHLRTSLVGLCRLFEMRIISSSIVSDNCRAGARSWTRGWKDRGNDGPKGLVDSGNMIGNLTCLCAASKPRRQYFLSILWQNPTRRPAR